MPGRRDMALALAGPAGASGYLRTKPQPGVKASRGVDQSHA
jgi:hypothetical protein